MPRTFFQLQCRHQLPLRRGGRPPGPSRSPPSGPFLRSPLRAGPSGVSQSLGPAGRVPASCGPEDGRPRCHPSHPVRFHSGRTACRPVPAVSSADSVPAQPFPQVVLDVTAAAAELGRVPAPRGTPAPLVPRTVPARPGRSPPVAVWAGSSARCVPSGPVSVPATAIGRRVRRTPALRSLIAIPRAAA